MKPSIVFYTLVAGDNINYHLEAILAVTSLLRFTKHKHQILVYTDNSTYYRCFSPFLNVKIIELDKTTIDEWSTIHNKHYFYRCKLKLLEKVIIENPQSHTCWFDTDCVAIKPIDHIAALLDDNIALMHKKEDAYSAGNSKQERYYWNKLQSYTYKDIKVNENSHQWNSGIIAIPRKKAKQASHAVDLLDNLLTNGFEGRTLEQVAIGLYLENLGSLHAIDSHILHYWNNKQEWHSFTLMQILPHLGDEQGIQRIITNVFTPSHINLPKLNQNKLSKKEKRKKKLRKHLGLLAPYEQ